MWTKAPQWQSRGVAPHSWLYRITYNLCIDALRKQKNRVAADSEASLSMAIAEEPLQHEIQQRAIEQAIAILPERQRAAIVLCTYHGLSNREAAETMDISVDALESLLSRARRKLREQLMQKEDIDS